MRIVDRKMFLEMPAGTVYMIFPTQPDDGGYSDFGYDGHIEIKEATCGNDFATQDIFPWFEGANDSGDLFTILDAMIRGEESPPIDYDFAGRQGLFQDDQLFCVWSKEDHKKLIDRLQMAYDQLTESPGLSLG